MGGIFSPLVHRQELPAVPFLPPNPIKSCIVFISEICYFRMTEIFSQLRREAEICKYVFGSVTVTMFSCCCFFFSEFEIVYYHFGRKKEKKNLYVNLSKYSKENKLAIKFSFYILVLLRKMFWQFEMCWGGKISKSKIQMQNYSGPLSRLQFVFRMLLF